LHELEDKYFKKTYIVDGEVCSSDNNKNKKWFDNLCSQKIAVYKDAVSKHNLLYFIIYTAKIELFFLV
jgi:hypothetical protein